MPVIGVIGGSGLYDIPELEIFDSVKMTTPYGEPSDMYRIGRLSDKEVVFLPRHGTMHHIQPNKINYRANIWGLRELGVTRILSVNATGGISATLRPGDIVLPDQIIDTTSGREGTFYDDEDVVHIDFTEPFCPELRDYVLRASEKTGNKITGKGTYICVNGPRLETAAEIKAYALLGADIVGMTLMPEAALARELEICFASISVVTNHAAGITGNRLTAAEVVEMMNASTEKIKDILKSFLEMELAEPSCLCVQALKDARM